MFGMVTFYTPSHHESSKRGKNHAHILYAILLVVIGKPTFGKANDFIALNVC